jgi:hypothetical protein
MKGLMNSPLIVSLSVDDVETLNAQENKKTTEMVIEKWNLGPMEPSEKPAENAEYWQEMAELWQVEEVEARRRVCANCEYFDNTPERMEVMDSVPFNEFDENAGGRGYCHKFDFICHNLRSCQAWERKDYVAEGDDFF